MDEKRIQRLNTALAKWRGAEAFFNVYRDHTSNQFVLGLSRSKDELEPMGISFFNCEYLAGPTRWSDVELVAQPVVCADGSPGYEVRDLKAGFVVRGAECVSIGDTGEVISVYE